MLSQQEEILQRRIEDNDRQTHENYPLEYHHARRMFLRQKRFHEEPQEEGKGKAEKVTTAENDAIMDVDDATTTDVEKYCQWRRVLFSSKKKKKVEEQQQKEFHFLKNEKEKEEANSSRRCCQENEEEERATRGGGNVNNKHAKKNVDDVVFVDDQKPQLNAANNIKAANPPAVNPSSSSPACVNPELTLYLSQLNLPIALIAGGGGGIGGCYQGRSKCTTDTQDTDLDSWPTSSSSASSRSDDDDDSSGASNNSEGGGEETTTGGCSGRNTPSAGDGNNHLEANNTDHQGGSVMAGANRTTKHPTHIISPSSHRRQHQHHQDSNLQTSDSNFNLNISSSYFLDDQKPETAEASYIFAHAPMMVPLTQTEPGGTASTAAGVTCLQYNHKGTSLAVGTSIGKLFVFPDGCRQQISVDDAQLLIGHNDALTDLTWSQSDVFLLTISLDAFIIVWDVIKSIKIRQISTGPHQPLVAKFLPNNNNIFVVGFRTPPMKVYNLSTGMVLKKMKCKYAVGAIATDPSGSFVFTGDAHGNISTYACSLENASVKRIIDLCLEKDKPVTCLSCQPTTLEVWGQIPTAAPAVGSGGGFLSAVSSSRKPAEVFSLCLLANCRCDAVFLIYVRVAGTTNVQMTVVRKFPVCQRTLSIRSCFCRETNPGSVTFTTGSEDGHIYLINIFKGRNKALAELSLLPSQEKAQAKNLGSTNPGSSANSAMNMTTISTSGVLNTTASSQMSTSNNNLAVASIMDVSWSNDAVTLAAGTNQGEIAFYRRVMVSGGDDDFLGGMNPDFTVENCRLPSSSLLHNTNNNFMPQAIVTTNAFGIRRPQRTDSEDVCVDDEERDDDDVNSSQLS